MSRLFSVVAIAALVLALVALPAPDQPTHGEAPAHNPSAFAVCPIIEGGGRTTEVAVVSTSGGPTSLNLFANGSTAGSIEVGVGDNGAAVIPVVDVAAVGTVGGLVELPSASAAASTRIQGAQSATLEACVTAIPAEVFLAGGSTAGQGQMTLHLMNPFAGDAVASLSVTSEVGHESSSRFERVIVPSRGSSVMQMNEIIPGREWVTVRIDISQGRVAAVVRQADGSGTAAWNAVAPAADWFLPIPTDTPGSVVIGSATPGDNEYQVDLYGPDGVEGAAITGVLSEGAAERISLEEVPGVRAIRVVSALPLVASLETGDEASVGVTTGATTPAGSWLIPSALSAGSARLVVLNPGLEDAPVVIRPLRPGSGEIAANVPAEGVVEVVLDGADGYLVDSTVPVVVLLAGTGENSGVLAIGMPIVDG